MLERLWRSFIADDPQPELSRLDIEDIIANHSEEPVNAGAVGPASVRLVVPFCWFQMPASRLGRG
jgi:hypothetical protein